MTVFGHIWKFIDLIIGSIVALSVRLYFLILGYKEMLFANNTQSWKEKLFDHTDVTTFQPPPLETMHKIFKLYEKIVDPVFFGMENIPTDRQRILFIGNHALYAIEIPLLLYKLYKDKNIYLRIAADYYHKYFPHWRLVKYFGAFDASRDCCSKLMEADMTFLIFPGGGREVLRRKADGKYRLIWGDRVGFARLAIKYKYTIIPFTSYGSEDMFDILVDIPLKPIIGRDLSIPIPHPPSPTKLQRIYFNFGKPIPTEKYNGEYENDAYAKELRDQVKHAVEEGFDFLSQKQKEDPDSYRLGSLLKEIVDSNLAPKKQD